MSPLLTATTHHHLTAPPTSQYTIILPASKNLPSQVVDFKKGKTQKRKSVGVRYPDEPIVQVGTSVSNQPQILPGRESVTRKGGSGQHCCSSPPWQVLRGLEQQC